MFEQPSFDQAEPAHKTPLQVLRSTIDNLEKFQLDIERALHYGLDATSFDDVARRVLTGDLKLYPLEKSCILVEIGYKTNFNTYHVYLAGGDLQEILAFVPTLVRDAEAAGCRYISMTGRHGWTKPLQRQGWTHELTTMHLEVPKHG